MKTALLVSATLTLIPLVSQAENGNIKIDPGIQTALGNGGAYGENQQSSIHLTVGAQAIVRDLLSAYNNNLIDINQIADYADYAVLAWAAYGEPDAIRLAKERGWTPLKSLANRNLLVGDTAAMLFVSDRGKHVVAFRGTELKTAKTDLVTDLAGTVDPTLLTNRQVDGAREIADEMVAAFPEVVFVGHSLGGRLAQVARFKTDSVAVKFNSAPVGFNDALKAVPSLKNTKASLVGFRSPDDPLTHLFPTSDTEVKNIVPAHKTAIKNLAASDYTHSMRVLALSMQDVRIARDNKWIDKYLSLNPISADVVSNKKTNIYGGGAKEVRMKWNEEPDVKAILKGITQNTSSQSLRGCATGHGPLTADQIRALLSETQITISEFRKEKKYLITDSKIQDRRDYGALCPNMFPACDRVYYCVSSETLFLLGTQAVTSVSRIDTSSVTQRKIKFNDYENASVSLKDPATGCLIRTGWNGADAPNSISWNGGCSGGIVSGNGVLVWKALSDNTSQTIWKTYVGPGWDTSLIDGQLSHGLDFSRFDFKLTECDSTSGSRIVLIHAPRISSEKYFENRWIVDRLLNQAVDYAVLMCPIERHGYSNIAVSITYPGDKAPMVRARNYDKDRLTWREFDNKAEKNLSFALKKQNDLQVAQERMRVADAKASLADRDLKAELMMVSNRAKAIFDGKAATPADLATAFHINKHKTLERIERGLTLDLKPTDGVRTIQSNGRNYYGVTYRATSLIAEVERKHRLQRMNQQFSWDDWFDQTSSFGKGGELHLTCLFDRISRIPAKARSVATKLVSFDSTGNTVNIIFTCQ